MSILGVRNSLIDLSARVDAHPDDAVSVYEQALLVDDALHDWAAQFPHDPWLPRFAYALAELYRKVDTEDARIRKNDTLDWLIATYPQSEYAQRPRICTSAERSGGQKQVLELTGGFDAELRVEHLAVVAVLCDRGAAALRRQMRRDREARAGFIERLELGEVLADL